MSAFDESAFATTLALIWLARHAQADHAEWARLAAKADGLLAAHVSDKHGALLQEAAAALVP